MATISVLQAPGRELCKRFSLDSAGNIAKPKIFMPTYFMLEQHEIENLQTLSSLLNKLEAEQDRMIVRGAPHESVDITHKVRRKTNNGRSDNPNENPFLDVAQPWLMIDIDKLELPETIKLLVEPMKAVEYAIEQLPPEFHDASTHWQLSASAGVYELTHISLHLYFWLNEPVLNERLRQWGELVKLPNGKKIVDTHLFQAVQPHYIAGPIFDGGLVDCFQGRRSGFLKNTKDAVTIDFSIIKQGEEQKKYQPRFDAVSEYRPRGLENILASIGDHEGGAGFRGPLLRATASWATVLGAERARADVEEFKAHLRLVIDQANQSEHTLDEIEVRKSDKLLDEFIATAIAKYGNKAQPDPYFDTQELELEAAQELLTKSVLDFGVKVKEYWSTPPSLNLLAPTLAIRATAGLGKTRVLIEKLIAKNILEIGDIHYYIPTHALGDQVGETMGASLDEERSSYEKIFKKIIVGQSFDQADAKIQMYPIGTELHVKVPRKIVHFSKAIRGRSWKGEDDKTLCQKNELAALLSKLGENVSTTLCENKEDKCEFHVNCAYQKQFESEDLIDEFHRHPDERHSNQVKILTHDHLFLRTKDKLPEPKLVIVDEAFWQKSIQKIEVNPLDLQMANEPAAILIFETLTKTHAPLLKTLRENGYTSEYLRKAADAIVARGIPSQRIHPSMNTAEQERILGANANRNKTPRILQQIAEELIFCDRDESHLIRYEESSRILKMQWRKELLISKQTPIIFIDADFQFELINQLYQEIPIVKIPVERLAEVHQFKDLTFSKSKILGKSIKSELFRQEINNFIGGVASHGRTLVISSKKVKENLATKSVGNSTENIFSGAIFQHFGAIRGLNEFNEFANVIVIGREQPPSNGIEDDAKALWWDDDNPFISLDEKNSSKPLINESRGYRMKDGSKAAVLTQVHPDERAQLILEQIREAESTQAIDRLRLLRPHPDGIQRRVFILSSVPLDITIDKLWGWGKLQRCLALWNEAEGVLPLNPEHMYKRCPSVGNASTAKDRAGDLRSSIPLINITIREQPLLMVKYAPQGQKSQNTAFVRATLSPEQVKTTLDELTGRPQIVSYKK